MGNAEELYAYIKKLSDFISHTNLICVSLTKLHLGTLPPGCNSPPKQLVLEELDKFEQLISQAEADGISDDKIFHDQVNFVKEAFSFFADDVPELKDWL